MSAEHVPPRDTEPKTQFHDGWQAYLLYDDTKNPDGTPHEPAMTFAELATLLTTDSTDVDIRLPRGVFSYQGPLPQMEGKTDAEIIHTLDLVGIQPEDLQKMKGMAKEKFTILSALVQIESDTPPEQQEMISRIKTRMSYIADIDISKNPHYPAAKLHERIAIPKLKNFPSITPDESIYTLLVAKTADERRMVMITAALAKLTLTEIHTNKLNVLLREIQSLILSASPSLARADITQHLILAQIGRTPGDIRHHIREAFRLVSNEHPLTKYFLQNAGIFHSHISKRYKRDISQDADILAHEAFDKVFRSDMSAEHGTTKTRFGRRMITSINNLVTDRGRLGYDQVAPIEEADRSISETGFEQFDQTYDVFLFLNKLPEHERELLIAKYFLDMKSEQILQSPLAKKFGWTDVNGVYESLRLVMIWLRRNLTEDLQLQKERIDPSKPVDLPDNFAFHPERESLFKIIRPPENPLKNHPIREKITKEELLRLIQTVDFDKLPGILKKQFHISITKAQLANDILHRFSGEIHTPTQIALDTLENAMELYGKLEQFMRAYESVQTLTLKVLNTVASSLGLKPAETVDLLRGFGVLPPIHEESTIPLDAEKDGAVILDLSQKGIAVIHIAAMLGLTEREIRKYITKHS